MRQIFIVPLLIIGAAAPASANEFEAAMRDYVESNLSSWANSPALIAAITAQNGETNGYDQTRIDELDTIWRAQVGSADATLVESVMNNDAALFLRQQVEQTGGAITEAFVMDAQGLNVAASHATSDYWQGDEAKFQQTYLVGPGSVHYGEIELDESTQTVQGQVSMTIVDDTTGEPIGALTVGINLTALM